MWFNSSQALTKEHSQLDISNDDVSTQVFGFAKQDLVFQQIQLLVVKEKQALQRELEKTTISAVQNVEILALMLKLLFV